jgi:hypothetical protein
LWYTRAPEFQQHSPDFNKLQHNVNGLKELGSKAVSITSAEAQNQVRDQEVGGSKPLAPTNLVNRFQQGANVGLLTPVGFLITKLSTASCGAPEERLAVRGENRKTFPPEVV